MIRLIKLLAAALLLSACTNANDLDEEPVYLGNFALGHNVAVAPNLTKGPASRDASAEEWIDATKKAIDERFSRYEGDSLYHLGISIEGYVLAVTGIPLVAAPKSALIIRVTAWDDAKGEKLNDEPKQITVVETVSANTLLGSGLTQSKEVQMENLTRNAAKLIQNWLVQENAANGWFEDEGVVSEAAESALAEDAEEDGEQTTPASATQDIASENENDSAPPDQDPSSAAAEEPEQTAAEDAATQAQIVLDPDVAQDAELAEE